MTTHNIVLTTCETWPELSRSDAQLFDELTRRGHQVTARPWNHAPRSDFAEADLVVLRSNWDSHHHREAFHAWITGVDASPARLVNDAALVLDHDHKSYLLRYAEAGLATPATLVADDFDIATIAAWMSGHDLHQVICKPAWGASGFGVDRLERSGLEAARQGWLAEPDRRPLVFQEFVPEIAAGEYALVFFAGQYSHALLRTPTSGDYRVNGGFGGRTVLAPEVPPHAIEFGRQVMSMLPEAVYARVDVVITDRGCQLMEVEVNEPALGLHLAPGAAARFADALLH